MKNCIIIIIVSWILMSIPAALFFGLFVKEGKRKGDDYE